MTIDDLKILLNFDLTDTSQDTVLQLIVDSVYSFLENELQYPLTVKTITERQEGNNTPYLSIKYYPIISLTSVNEFTQDLSSSTDITNNIDINVYKNRGLLYRKDGFFFKKNYIYEVIYDAGYSTLPADLEYLLRQIGLSMYSQITNIKDGVDRVSTPDGTFYYRKELITPAMQSIIDKYRKIHI